MAGADASSYFLSGVRFVFLCVLCALHFKPASNLNFENIAFGKNYKQSSGSSAHRPADGYSNTCINTGRVGNVQHWWEVDLGRKYPVYSITVLGMGADNKTFLYPFEITVDGNLCARLETGSASSQSLVCSNVIYGRIVRLTRTETDGLELILCELRIVVCLMGWYGPDCGKQCPVNCNRGCSQDTGDCTECKKGFYGSDCSLHSLTCQNVLCQRCDRQAGECTACYRNLQPPTCTECLDGFFGYSYRECLPCSGQCYNNTPCNKTTGNCSKCPPGRTGNKCFDECPWGKYGQECEEDCGNCKHTSCNVITGECTQCNTGYQLPFCKQVFLNTTECDDGHYGYNCDMTCGRCKGGAACSKTDGRCPQDLCEPGWYPPNCTTAECDDGRYGDDCNRTCGRCKGGAACSKTDGRCPEGLCEPGWYSPSCMAACQDGFYGENCTQKCGICEKNVVCNKTNGYCPCPTREQPPNCTTAECDDGRYGDGCNRTCGRCKGGAACSKTDGKCPQGLCEPGLQPQLCQTACQNHTYGPDCKQRCGQCQDHLPCDPYTGDCPSGCQPGYIGQRCQMTSEARQDGLPVAAVTSLSIVVMVVCTIVFLGIVWYRRRARRTSRISKLEKKTDREATNLRNPTEDRSAAEEEMQQSEYDDILLEDTGDNPDQYSSTCVDVKRYSLPVDSAATYDTTEAEMEAINLRNLTGDKSALEEEKQQSEYDDILLDDRGDNPDHNSNTAVDNEHSSLPLDSAATYDTTGFYLNADGGKYSYTDLHKSDQSQA